ncbi:hypothetical protein IAG44_40930 [Streptomyces roseirectus]|uniref:Uncharacterized protein n=1 Tax=Streptomyces roseirectus TaxID=2768066 RepID=A0A7H0IQT2_9ACTN|nr:hypothetical protein [Streptomyces roseirectus]QNP75148.1 hypothetical protein IAG44_40930 [Streptomyces roseirectus]
MTRTVSGEKTRGTAGTRTWGAVLVLLAALPAVATYVVFALWIPSDIDRYDDYKAARACGTAPPVEWSEDCVRTVRMTVDRRELTRRQSGELTATTVDAPSRTYETSFGSRTPVLKYLDKGDEFTGTVWRGDLMTIAKGDDRQVTTDEPRNEYQMPAGLGTFTALLSALLLAHGVLRLARPRTHTRSFLGPPNTKRLVISVGIVCFVVGLICVWTGVPWWLVPLLITALSVAVGHLNVNWDREPAPGLPAE